MRMDIDEIYELIKEFGYISNGTYTLSKVFAKRVFKDEIFHNIYVSYIDDDNIFINFFDIDGNIIYIDNNYNIDYLMLYNYLKKSFISYGIGFIKENVTGINGWDIVYYDDGFWNIHKSSGYLQIQKNLVVNGKLIIKFGKVNTTFYCNNIGLTTLEGVPYYVGGYFHCDDNLLTKLTYSPFCFGTPQYSSRYSLMYLRVGPTQIGLPSSNTTWENFTTCILKSDLTFYL
jgi:hypothetical protein